VGKLVEHRSADVIGCEAVPIEHPGHVAVADAHDAEQDVRGPDRPVPELERRS
jgi:hypothetical protein